MELMDKVFFLPGDTVTLKQDIPNKPIMIVVGKSTSTINIRGVKSNFFQGIKCKWFTSTGEIQSEVFSTKDLIKIK